MGSNSRLQCSISGFEFNGMFGNTRSRERLLVREERRGFKMELLVKEGFNGGGVEVEEWW